MNKKLNWGLFPWKQLREVQEQNEFGAEKHAPWDWQTCYEKDPDKLMIKIFRHWWEYYVEKKKRDESGKSHLAAIVCDALYRMWYDDNEKGCIKGVLELLNQRGGIEAYFCGQCKVEMESMSNNRIKCPECLNTIRLKEKA